ncbi:MAG: NAD(+) diphosphatase [Sphingomonadaceae bacterium]
MPGFTGSPLDRVDHIRSDIPAYQALLADWRGRLLGLEGLDPMLSADGMLVWQSMADAAEDAELILLGLIDERPHFVALTHATGAMMRSPAIFRALSLLPTDQAAIYGTARSLIDWHNNHLFCGGCGGATILFRAGWGRKCTACQKEHFPRTDPVVIMLAEYEGKVLVGRQSRFPPGNYSALAGFLEPGESIEEAVRRELFEESGIRTGTVRYVASQPWPFGSQLMIACIAKAEGDEITLDTNELEDAMWVTRDEAIASFANAPDARFKPPPHFAIAHTLLQRWIDGA